MQGCSGVDSATWGPKHGTGESKDDDLDQSIGVNDPHKYGFGSVHNIYDIGDSAKLVSAMERVEDDDQPTNYDPVVVVGGGFIAMEVCSMIAST